MRSQRVFALSSVSLLALLAGAGTALATEEIGTQEKLACVACHDKPGSKLLTDQGKFYETMRSLDGFDDLKATFGKCTSCHVKKPGSTKLTEKGEQFRFMLQDMQGLRAWMKEHHPAAPAKPEPKPSETPSPTAPEPDRK